MYEFKIEVKREGRWWMVAIPEIDGVTQARRLSEVETMAREYIALDRNIPLDDVKVETASIRIEEPAFREILEAAREIKAKRARAQELEREATQNAEEFAHWLTTYGVPVRDIAELLEISPQRVSQLANA
jgi:predicted XRE-type DNA-binding protein